MGRYRPKCSCIYGAPGGSASGGAIFTIAVWLTWRRHFSYTIADAANRVWVSLASMVVSPAERLHRRGLAHRRGGDSARQTVGKSRFSGFGADPDGDGGSGNGGAIFQAAGELQVSGAVFDSNVSTGGYGQNFFLSTGPDGNANGGGLCLLGGTVIVQGCTFAMNRAAGTANGGGFCNLEGIATVRGCSCVMNRESGLDSRDVAGPVMMPEAAPSTIADFFGFLIAPSLRTWRKATPTVHLAALRMAAASLVWLAQSVWSTQR